MDNISQQFIIGSIPTLKFLNFDYIFKSIYNFFIPIADFFKNPDTWFTIEIVSNILSIIFIGIIIYSLIRLVEIQIDDKRELNHKIEQALLKEKELEKMANPRWHYIETMVESSNESDWRVAIIEADSMLEEILKDKGLFGNTVSEFLESAKDSGYANLSDAWDAHLVRNKIAHEGSDFSLSQVETRRAIKMYSNFFKELDVI